MATGRRVCLVDCEMAGLGPGVAGPAARCSGWEDPTRQAVAWAYRVALAPGLEWPLGMRRTWPLLDSCSPCVAVQWVSWSRVGPRLRSAPRTGWARPCARSAARTLTGKTGRSMRDRRRVVDGDDLGRTPGIDREVRRAYEQGISTSASLMVQWSAGRRGRRSRPRSADHEPQTAPRPRRVGVPARELGSGVRRRADGGRRGGRRLPATGRRPPTHVNSTSACTSVNP